MMREGRMALGCCVGGHNNRWRNSPGEPTGRCNCTCRIRTARSSRLDNGAQRCSAAFTQQAQDRPNGLDGGTNRAAKGFMNSVRPAQASGHGATASQHLGHGRKRSGRDGLSENQGMRFIADHRSAFFLWAQKKKKKKKNCSRRFGTLRISQWNSSGLQSKLCSEGNGSPGHSMLLSVRRTCDEPASAKSIKWIPLRTR